jgi:hypothetical protein
MRNEENFDYPFGQWQGKLDGRLTNLHGFVTGNLFKNRIMRMCEEWEELVMEIGGNK